MQRFFVEPHQIDEAAHQIHIIGTDVNHISNVLRMKQGEEVWISDGGQKEYRCAIEAFSADEVLLHIIYAQEPDYELQSRIYLFQGLPKADKMELVIQKAVELGAFEVIPVAMKRSVVKLDAKKAESKVKRWNAIAESAAKQSKRSILPQVSDVVTFAQAVKMAENCQIKLLPYECADGMEKTKRLIENITPGQDIAVFIGPEGGFDLDELELAKEAGCEIITLGKRILRTETAGMMLLSVLMYHLEQ